MELKKLTKEQIQQGWKIIEKRFQFLLDRGIDQYPSIEYLRETYDSKVVTGTCYGLVEGEQVTSIVILTPNKVDEEWEFEYPTSFVWLSSFFTDPDFAGIGCQLLDYVKEFCHDNGYGAILLDCHTKEGVLEGYYQKHGFKIVTKKPFVYGERSFTSALMEYKPEVDLNSFIAL